MMVASLSAKLICCLTAEAEKRDCAEDEELGADVRGDEMPEALSCQKTRLRTFRKAKERLEATHARKEEAAGQNVQDGGSGLPAGGSQTNFTDPESKIMKTGEGWQQGYNAQAAVDGEKQLIVAAEVSADANDHGKLNAMVD